MLKNGVGFFEMRSQAPGADLRFCGNSPPVSKSSGEIKDKRPKGGAQNK